VNAKTRNEFSNADNLLHEAALVALANMAKADRERVIRIAAPATIRGSMIDLAVERSGRLALAKFDRRLRVTLQVEAQR
jgi:hypothetical protein